MSESERFRPGSYGEEVGIIDEQKKMFAPFYGKNLEHLKWRLDRAAAWLNSGKETPTGYVWQKMSQVGTGGG